MNLTHKDNSKYREIKKYMSRIKGHGKGKSLKNLANHKTRNRDVSNGSNYKKLVDCKSDFY
jgi:hypothetical protein